MATVTETRPAPKPSVAADPAGPFAYGTHVRHRGLPGRFRVVSAPGPHRRRPLADRTAPGVGRERIHGRAYHFVLRRPGRPRAGRGGACADPRDRDRDPSGRRALAVVMVLSINGTGYGVAPVAAAGKAFRLAKCQDDHATYFLEETRDSVTCDCPDFIYRREGLDAGGM